MRSTALIFVSGLLFAIGLGVSGMTDANKVLAFLDLAGQWDPTLAFVMLGALLVHFGLYRLVMRRACPVYADCFSLPNRTDIDWRLVTGAALFGIGWGIGGYCPGPGIVSISALSAPALIFIGFMLAGMSLFHRLDALGWISQRGFGKQEMTCSRT